jgi:hypothetical protein
MSERVRDGSKGWRARDGRSCRCAQSFRRGRRSLLSALTLILITSLAVMGSAGQAGALDQANAARVMTTLRPAPISIVQTVTSIRLTYTATLTVTSTRSPVAGAYVLFEDTSFLPSQLPLANLVCEPQTNAAGVAACSITILDLPNTLEHPTYTAEFFGSSQYLPSVAAGGLAVLPSCADRTTGPPPAGE